MFFHFDSHIEIEPASAGSVIYIVTSFFFNAFYFDSYIEIEPLSNVTAKLHPRLDHSSRSARRFHSYT